MNENLFNTIKSTVNSFSESNEQDLSELSNQLQSLSQADIMAFHDVFMTLNTLLSKQVYFGDPLLYELAIITCKECNVSIEDLVGGKKSSKEISFARQIFSYIARDTLFYHPQVISSCLQQDRTNINYQCKTLANLLLYDKHLTTIYNNVNSTLHVSKIFSDRKKERFGFPSQS